MRLEKTLIALNALSAEGDGAAKILGIVVYKENAKIKSFAVRQFVVVVTDSAELSLFDFLSTLVGPVFDDCSENTTSIVVPITTSNINTKHKMINTIIPASYSPFIEQNRGAF